MLGDYQLNGVEHRNWLDGMIDGRIRHGNPKADMLKTKRVAREQPNTGTSILMKGIHGNS